MRRHAILALTIDLALDMMKVFEGVSPRTIQVVKNPLPDDVTFVRAFVEERSSLFCLVLESDSFEEVEGGGVLPVLPAPQFAVMTTDSSPRPFNWNDQ